MGLCVPGQQNLPVEQTGFTGSLLHSAGTTGCAATTVDTLNGLLLAAPSRNHASHHVISFLTRYVLTPFGLPDIIDSYRGMISISNFTSQVVLSWALEHGILWNFHLAYWPQAAGLIERHSYLTQRHAFQAFKL